VDTNTRRALKKDSLATAAATSAHWMSDHRSSLFRTLMVSGVVLILLVGVVVLCNVQSAAADSALNAALDTYSAPLAAPGAPLQSGEYATAADRVKKANEQFAAAASKYGWLPQGSKAHYFVGVTDADMGQAGAAETELKIAAGSWNHNLANLARLALANLYHQSSRDSEAIEEYNQIIAKPSRTVPASLAQLNLADLYAATGKNDQARALWAKIKDSDKEGAAGSMAAQKLTAGR